MGKKKPTDTNSASQMIRAPALTPEERENQLISLAVNRAEQQLADGTASAQVIVHYLKLASSQEKQKNALLQKQVELLQAKIDQIHSAQNSEDLYARAIEAMRSYSGIE